MRSRFWRLLIVLPLSSAAAVQAGDDAPAKQTAEPSRLDQGSYSNLEPLVRASCPEGDLDDLLIVDAHSHLFNARYLPIKGIFYKFYMGWPLAPALARIVHNAAGQITKDDLVQILERQDTPALMESARSSAVPRSEVLGFLLLDNLEAKMSGQIAQLDKRQGQMKRVLDLNAAEDPEMEGTGLGVAEGQPAWRDLFVLDQRVAPALVDAQALELRPSLRLLLNILFRAFADAGHELTGIGAFHQMAIFLADEDLALELIRADLPCVDLFIHQMMDLDATFRDFPKKGPTRYDLTERVQRVETLDSRHDEILASMKAFDPFRREWPKPAGWEGTDQDWKRRTDQWRAAFPDWGSGQLDLLYGRFKYLKFYPPSGYRPAACYEDGDEPTSCIPSKPTGPFPAAGIFRGRMLRRQHSSRYKKLGGNDLERANNLDNRIGAFLEWAKDNGKTVFSHHTPKGFQSYRKYGEEMADPRYWNELLERKDGGAVPWSELKLVLAHSGGGDAWFGKKKRGEVTAWPGSFDQHAANLCVTYPNVYCDFGNSNEMIHRDEETRRHYQKHFQKNLERLVGYFENPESDGPPPSCSLDCDVRNPRYDIRKKIIFGTDWWMSAGQQDQGQIAQSFLEVFTSEHLQGYEGRFFSENVLTALGCQSSGGVVDCSH